MSRLVIYIHGKGGNAKEAEHYKPLFPKYDVIGFDYQSQNPWDAKREFSKFYDKATKGYDSTIVIANSIGAFFTLVSLADKKIERAFFISPIVDMQKLIRDMMQWAGVTIEELQKKGEIPTNFGETLSWNYYSYVCKHLIEWKIPTYILYGEKDNMTSKETITEFAKKKGASLTIMSDGEHWFHTEKQMEFLDCWISICIEGGNMACNMIELKIIDENNFLDAFQLKLAEEQEKYVSNPIRSLAQAYVYRNQCQPFGIYDKDEMVGYVMVIYDYDIPEYDIWHMMIDASKQGKGYGSAALKKVLEYIRTKPFGDSNRVTLTCNKENQIALRLYRKAGFVETSVEDEEEIELSQTLV